MKKKQKDILTVEGWINILHCSAKKNLNNGDVYFILLDNNKAAYILRDVTLYGAILSLPHTRFYISGELNFRAGWFLNVKDVSLLDADGNLESVSRYCPEGFSLDDFNE